MTVEDGRVGAICIGYCFTIRKKATITIFIASTADFSLYLQIKARRRIAMSILPHRLHNVHSLLLITNFAVFLLAVTHCYIGIYLFTFGGCLSSS